MFFSTSFLFREEKFKSTVLKIALGIIIFLLAFQPVGAWAGDFHIFLVSPFPESYFSSFFQLHFERLLGEKTVRFFEFSAFCSALSDGNVPWEANSRPIVVFTELSLEHGKKVEKLIAEKGESLRPLILGVNCQGNFGNNDFLSLLVDYHRGGKEIGKTIKGRGEKVLLAHRGEFFVDQFQSGLREEIGDFKVVCWQNEALSSDFLEDFEYLIITSDFLTQEIIKILIRDTSLSEKNLIVLEASTRMLTYLQEGKINLLLDTKPSRLAGKLVNWIEKLEKGEEILEREIFIPPLIITPSNLEEADSYEVLVRCFLCGRGTRLSGARPFNRQ